MRNHDTRVVNSITGGNHTKRKQIYVFAKHGTAALRHMDVTLRDNVGLLVFNLLSLESFLVQVNGNIILAVG